MQLDEQKRELEEALWRQGWRISVMERPFEYEWWAEEFWVVQCDPPESPEAGDSGPAVWLTFLVDPISDGRQVWAVLACRERLSGFQTAAGRPQLELGEDWREDIAGFIDELNDWCRSSEI